MNNNYKFSIIIPVFNVEPYIDRCIQSVINQNYNNFEIIIVNDGSTDSSAEICYNYANSYNNIQIIHQTNQGLSSARNTGIKLATGDYILFLDSDDYWIATDVLERINFRINITKPDVLSFNYQKFNDEGFKPPYFSVQTMPYQIYDDTFEFISTNCLWRACAWNKAIKRSLFSNYNLYFIHGITAEDIDWCLRLALYAESFDYISDVIVCYRQRSNSISNNISSSKLFTLLQNIDRCFLIIEHSNNTKRVEFLKEYIGYTYATAFWGISEISNKKERTNLINCLNKRKYSLQWSNDKKVKLIYYISKIGGIKLTLFLINRFKKLMIGVQK